MKLIKFFFLILIVTPCLLTTTNAKENLAFINLDELIKNSNYGKIILNEIKSLNEKNIEELKKMETELKFDEKELNKKKNILSKNDFENELNILEEKISKYRKFKDEMTKSFKEYKNKNLNVFFSKINPIIQDYMDEHSIDILLRQEYVFIGKNSADITDVIIKKINSKIN